MAPDGVPGWPDDEAVEVAHPVALALAHEAQQRQLDAAVGQLVAGSLPPRLQDLCQGQGTVVGPADPPHVGEQLDAVVGVHLRVRVLVEPGAERAPHECAAPVVTLPDVRGGRLRPHGWGFGRPG